MDSPPSAEVPEPHGPGLLSVAGVDPERNFAGGETQVLGLTLELRAMGHRAELLCDPAGELWRRARAADVACHPMPIRNALDVFAAAALRRALGAGRYDVVHFHTSRAHAMAPWVRGLARAAVVTRRMDYVPNRLFARWLYGRRAVDGIAAISSGVADALARAAVERERVVVIPSGIDCTHFRPPSANERSQARAALGLGDADLAIGALGVLEARKGHRYLMEAMALLSGRGGGAAAQGGGVLRDYAAQHAAACGGIVAIIAGDGSLRDSLAAEIRRLGLGDEGGTRSAGRLAPVVRMTGQVEDARAILWALDIFAMPSLSEGLGVALLEAMACGLPAVASRVGGIVDAVEEGSTGMLIAPGDARALAGALVRLGADAPGRNAMGAAARALAVERFSMATMARRTVELYRACLQTGASAKARGEG
jgi:glycosyltransferase involved in cell wall biosynthesis